MCKSTWNPLVRWIMYLAMHFTTHTHINKCGEFLVVQMAVKSLLFNECDW